MKGKAFIFLLLSAFIIFTGCSSDDNESETHNHNSDLYNRDYIIQELVNGIYTAQTISIPYDLGEIGNITYNNQNNKIYFSATSNNYGDADSVILSSNNVDIYSINSDGTELTLLIDYKPFVVIPEDMGGWIYIQEMVFDSVNNLWLLETWGTYTYNLPANTNIHNVGSDELLESITVHDMGNIIRKIDITGSEQLSVDVSFLLNNERYIHSFTVDSEENIYI